MFRLVIDAVDESDDPFSLMQALLRLSMGHKNASNENCHPLKVLIFARPEYDLGGTFKDSGWQLDITPIALSKDIGLYIDNRIDVFCHQSSTTAARSRSGDCPSNGSNQQRKWYVLMGQDDGSRPHRAGRGKS